MSDEQKTFTVNRDDVLRLINDIANKARIISELEAAQGIAVLELKRLRDNLAELDAIEAAITAGEEPEPHIQRYKQLAKYMAGFRVINQQLIDDNAAAWNRVSVLTAEAKASKELAAARLRTIHGLNLKLKNLKQPTE